MQGVEAVKHCLLRHKITHKLSILLYCCETGAKVNAIKRSAKLSCSSKFYYKISSTSSILIRLFSSRSHLPQPVLTILLFSQTALSSLVKLLKSRPHLSQSVVEFLLGQLHLSCDPSRVLMCHALAAIATHLPVLGDGMLGDLVDLYRVASHSSNDKQQELLVRDFA